MKKAMLLASLAALSISGSAMALPAVPGVQHAVCIANQPAGFMSFAPLGPGLGGNVGGPAAPFGVCNYHGRWSPIGGPFNALTCTLTELSTSTSLGCFGDSMISIPTLVTAGGCGPNFALPLTVCSGFDQFGISHFDGVDLLLAETAIPGTVHKGIPLLTGVVTFKKLFFPMPQSITIGC